MASYCTNIFERSIDNSIGPGEYDAESDIQLTTAGILFCDFEREQIIEIASGEAIA